MRPLLAVDIDTGAFRFRKNRKLYFTDPLLYWLSLDLGAQSALDDVESRIAELVANEALARCLGRFGYFDGPSGEIATTKPDTGEEV